MKNLHSYEEFLEDRRKAHVSPTAHVLGCFLHEFAHIQNFSNMEKLGRSPNEIVSKIRKIPISEKLREYISNRYDYDFRRDNLLDLFAEIVEKRLADGLDSETLLTNKNPFSELKFSEITPLRKQKYSNECDRDIIFNRLLNGIYEGDLKKIKDNYSYFA